MKPGVLACCAVLLASGPSQAVSMAPDAAQPAPAPGSCLTGPEKIRLSDARTRLAMNRDAQKTATPTQLAALRAEEASLAQIIHALAAKACK